MDHRQELELGARAPMLGEHTREICRDWLGLEDAEIDRRLAEEILEEPA